MTAEKVRSAQSQLENLKSLKSVVMGNANAFAKELSDARQKLDAISKAIADKQKVFHEKIQREEALKEAARTAEPAAEPKAAQEKTKQSEEKESKTVVEEKKSEPATERPAAAKQETSSEAVKKESAADKKTAEVKKTDVNATEKSDKEAKDAQSQSVAEKTNQKTYTDEKGNVRVRRFLTDFDKQKLNSISKPRSSDTSKRFGDKNQRTASQSAAQGARAPYGTAGRGGQSAGSRTSSPSLPRGPRIGFAPLPPVMGSAGKNFGNKNKTPEKSDDKRNTASKKQLLMRTYNPGLDEDDERMLARRARPKKQEVKFEPIIKVIDHAVVNTKDVPIKVLSEKIGVPVAQIIKQLFKEGIIKTINDTVEFEYAEYIASNVNVTLELQEEKTAEEILLSGFETESDGLEDNTKRPPIVTVMGHVDHGKTSLLDAIRHTNVTSGEAGGITQHIGAYTVSVNNETITFIDTPGHEAFTAMRARGAKVTDVAIIVVAADDGVMPQTVEAINHAKAAEVSIIVAINKVDKPAANLDRVKQQLSEYELLAEDWGGDTIMVPVSAKTGAGIKDLLEAVLLVTEIKELKANPEKQAVGTVIEAKLDKGRGPVATVLIKNGTLSIGDSVIAGTVVGKIRAMFDDKGRRVKSAGPSIPVEVLGFDDVPVAGDIMHAGTEKMIKSVAEERKSNEKLSNMKAASNVTLGDLFSKINEGQLKTLNLIIKTDVQGSLEALKVSLAKISNEEVKVSPIHGGVGAINENDVMLARASNAIIIGFNVRPDANAKATAEAEGVDIRLYRIIYDAVDDITKAMKGMLAPKFKEEILGQISVRNVFKITGVGAVAGCYVTSGKITRDSKIRIYRDNVIVHDGEILALKRFKDDVKEVSAGFECGVSIQNYNDIKVDDVFEAYKMEQIVD